MKRAQRFWIVLLVSAWPIVPSADAQSTSTYHLHGEPSDVGSHLVLSVANPDTATQTVLSADLKSQPAGTYLVKEFVTPVGIPGTETTIPSGSQLNFVLHMRQTSSFGITTPRVTVRVNGSTGTPICTAMASTGVTTTVSAHVFGCTTTSGVTLSASDRLYLWVGVQMVEGPGNKSMSVELSVEGVLNANYDSRIVVPLPPPPGPPNISALSPIVGPTGQPITISGANFGSTQGTNTVTFNGTVASVTSWTAGSIGVVVPAAATTGPVVVTVGGQPSTGVNFTVLPEGYQATYHLHQDQPFGSFKLMSTAGPNDPATTLSTTDLKNAAPFSASFHQFFSPEGDPGAIGTTAPGTVTFAVWMRKTSSYGTFFPLATLSVNYPNSQLVCQATGTAALTTTFTRYTLTCPTNGGVPVTLSDRWYVGVGVNMTVGPGNHSVRVEFGVEGVLNGNYDSTVVTPSIVPPPTIVSLTPGSGVVGASVTIMGTKFLSTQGASTVTFNGVAATPTNWSDTSIVVPVPAGAATGNVVVTVLNQPSNGRPFTVVPLGQITYVYDEVGRLVSVYDTLGSGAHFHYDAVGNLISIDRTFP
jgi:YD repeat-containing protein